MLTFTRTTSLFLELVRDFQIYHLPVSVLDLLVSTREHQPG
jgi:hypothetical protein